MLWHGFDASQDMDASADGCCCELEVLFCWKGVCHAALMLILEFILPNPCFLVPRRALFRGRMEGWDGAME